MTSNYEKHFEKDYQKILDKYDKKSEQYKQLIEKDMEIERLKVLLNMNVNVVIRKYIKIFQKD